MHRLALKLGHPDPFAMGAAMPMSTYIGWYRHYLREPWGAPVVQHYGSVLTWLLGVQVFKDKPKPDDFTFRLLPKPKPTGQGLVNKFKMVAAAMRGHSKG